MVARRRTALTTAKGPSGDPGTINVTKEIVERNSAIFGVTLQPNTDVSQFDRFIPTQPSERTINWWLRTYAVQQKFHDVLWPEGKKPTDGIHKDSIYSHFQPIKWPEVNREFLLQDYWPLTRHGYEAELWTEFSDGPIDRFLFVVGSLTVHKAVVALLTSHEDFSRDELVTAVGNMFKLRLEKALVDGNRGTVERMLTKWEKVKG